MKFATVALIAALSASGYAQAQSAMNHDHMHMQGMAAASASAEAKSQTASAVGVVKSVNAAKGSVSIAHEAIPALKWPPMTMSFQVKDKKLMDKLTVGSKVNFEIAQQGSDYVITAVK